MAQHGESKALEELVRRVQKNIFAMFSYLTDKRQPGDSFPSGVRWCGGVYCLNR